MTHTPRIAPQSMPLPPALDAAMARLLPPGIPPPQLFLTVGRNAGLFSFLVDSGLIGPTGLLDRHALSAPLRECVILRTCVATGNDYEFNLHVQTISARMGLSAGQIDDVRRQAPAEGLWSREQLAAMRLVDGLVPALAVDDATFALCRQVFDEPTLIEITQLVGLYVGVAMQVALARPAFDAYRSAKPVLARLDA
jgi:4-carboxymuconolactone decarboxylase